MSLAESPIITLDTLRENSRSAEASQNLRRYRELRDEGNQTLIICCGDARHSLPSLYPSLRSLGAGAPLQGYERVLNNGVRNAAVMGHFDGDLFVEELLDEAYTCAARNVKGRLLHGTRPENEADRYFSDNVTNPSLLPQTLYASREASSLTPKKVLGAIQDHLTGEVFPFAVLQNGEVVQKRRLLDPLMSRKLTVSLDDFREYGVLKEADVPDEFRGFLEDTRAYTEHLRSLYPDLNDRLKVHNPSLMIVTSSPKDVKTRLPMLTSIPGYYVKVTVPRVSQKSESPYTKKEYDYLHAQIGLLAHESNASHDQAGTAYSNLNSVIIDRGSMHLAIDTTNHLLEESEDFYDWYRRPDTHLYVAQVGNKFTPAKPMIIDEYTE